MPFEKPVTLHALKTVAWIFTTYIDVLCRILTLCRGFYAG